MSPDYKKIYTDIINKKHPDKLKTLQRFLNKKYLDSIDIINLNEKIFGKRNMETMKFNQQHRAYTRETILFFLDYQKKYKLNNSQLALEFSLSRNTITKWKKFYP